MAALAAQVPVVQIHSRPTPELQRANLISRKRPFLGADRILSDMGSHQRGGQSAFPGNVLGTSLPWSINTVPLTITNRIPVLASIGAR